MAGVKGRSGGARKGAGRKPKPRAAPIPPAQVPQAPTPAPMDAGTTDAKAFLEDVIAGRRFALKEQIDAAKALLPFQHAKLGEVGKKDQRKEAAGKVSRFAPAPPRMAMADAKKH